jgi:hypothetical protein
MTPHGPCQRWARRAGWMFLIWTASVVALAIAALSIRMIMHFAGLTA